MRRCMECIDFSSDPFAFLFFCNLYACSDSFTPHRKRLSENHAPCNRAEDFSSLSTYPRGLECLTICKGEAKAATSQLLSMWGPCRAYILRGSETNRSLPFWSLVPFKVKNNWANELNICAGFFRIRFYLLVRHLSKGNRKFLAEIKNCSFFTELQPTKTGGLLQVLPTTSFIWFIPRIHDWRETDYWTALTYAWSNCSRAWWHQVVKYIVIALGYSVRKIA